MMYFINLEAIETRLFRPAALQHQLDEQALAVTGKFFPFVALASSTAVAPAPPRANANRQIATVPGPGSDRSWALTNANGQPKEEEQFMELIFPGFDGDTFIWNVTLAQIAAFAFTMWVGHQKANPTPCALYSSYTCFRRFFDR